MFRVKGRSDFHGNTVVRAFDEASFKRLGLGALVVEQEAKVSMQKGGKKRLQGRDKKGRFKKARLIQIPSKPGTPPHVQTGNLRASITIQPTNRRTYIIGPTSNAAYGKVHEFGGRHHPKRPFMRPALLRAQPKIMRLMQGLPVKNTPMGRALNARKGFSGRGRK